MTLQNFVKKKMATANKTAESQGYPLKLEKCKKYKNMKQLEIYGNSFQDGTPSPDNPIEVQCVGELVTDETDSNYGKYKIPIIQRGKNLFKPTRVGTTGFSIYNTSGVVSNGSHGTIIDSCDYTDNKVVVTQTPNSDYSAGHYMNGDLYIKHEGLVVGKKYKISFDIEITSNPFNVSKIDLYPGGMYSNMVYAYFTQNKQRVSQTFTEIVNTSGAWFPYMEIRCMGMSFTASNFMITEVDEDTEFEPYVEPVTTNVFLDEPLRRVGNQADFIDFKANKVYRKIHKYYLDGSQKVTKYSDTICLVECNVRCKLTQYVTGGCSHFSSSVGVDDIPWILQANAVGQVVQISMYKRINGVTDADTLKQWFKENPVTYYAVRETTKEKSITLDLPKLNTKTTIIEVGTNLAPSSIYGKYVKR